MDPKRFRELIAEKKGGPGDNFLRFLLKIASQFYSAAVRIRNFSYDKGGLKTHKAPVPVISVGNITAGGTGKTPLVIWLCNYLQGKNVRPAVLTRGYRSGKGTLSDEPAILIKSCPGAKIIVNPDRVAGATKAVEKLRAQILIMDDGFQHRRLARDLEIAAIDATCPFGYEQLLPAGLLREPVKALARADVAVITRTNQVSAQQLADLEERLKLLNPKMVIAKSTHTPVCAKALKGRQISLDELRTKKIFAFCGIGNPQAFEYTLEQLGLNIRGTKVYSDHHRYSPADICDIYEEGRYLNADVILTTQKDWVKTALPAMGRGNILFAYLDIRLELVAGEDKITRLIDNLLP